jgi:hypothetical protein
VADFELSRLESVLAMAASETVLTKDSIAAGGGYVATRRGWRGVLSSTKPIAAQFKDYFGSELDSYDSRPRQH